jgi:Mg2+ and Co2+ transporter CorA
MDENNNGNKRHMNELITFRDSAISQVQTLTGLAKEAQEFAEGLQKDMNDQTVAHAQETEAQAKEMGALQDILSLPVMRFARRISEIQNRIAKKFAGGDRG